MQEFLKDFIVVKLFGKRANREALTNVSRLGLGPRAFRGSGEATTIPKATLCLELSYATWTCLFLILLKINFNLYKNPSLFSFLPFKNKFLIFLFFSPFYASNFSMSEN